jgi:type IV secretory pathway VirB10-like protein
MASTARIFFAGVGTTFLIIGVGFSGGLLMANAPSKEQFNYQAKAKADPSPIRVILPTSAEAAQPPQPSAPVQAAAAEPVPEPIQVLPAEKSVETIDTKKAERQERDRRKRIAEQRAKRQMPRVRQRQQLYASHELRVTAFDSAEPRQQDVSFSVFGN